MLETEHFINDGYGWTCKRCRKSEGARSPERDARARFFHEGEAEEREPRLATRGLARRRDDGPAGRRVLYCPDCGVEEEIVTDV